MTIAYPPLHLVDTTMFWSRSIGGVRRFLEAKHRWFAQQPAWRHTLAVPSVSSVAGVEQPRWSVAVPSWPLPGSGGYRLPVRRAAAARVLAGLAPDIIEADDPYRLAWAALDAARRRRIPAVAFCHSNLEQMARLHAGRGAAAAARRYMRHLYRQFDLVLAPSHAMCAALADCGVTGVQRQPLGVDAVAFHPSRRSDALRRSLGLVASDHLLVYAGRFAPEKNLPLLAAAVDRLGNAYTLLAIGDGPAPPRGARVVVRPFMRAQTELAAAVASADALVHAGNQETFGLTVLEAMACGTPVVARAAHGLAELVDEHVGVPVRADTASAYAEAIAHCVGLDRTTLGTAARSRALEYDWSVVLPQLAARYLRLLPQRAAGASAHEPLAAEQAA